MPEIMLSGFEGLPKEAVQSALRDLRDDMRIAQRSLLAYIRAYEAEYGGEDKLKQHSHHSEHEHEVDFQQEDPTTRKHTVFEKREDFAAITKSLDDMEDRHRQLIGTAIVKVRNDLLYRFDTEYEHGGTDFLNRITMNGLNGFPDVEGAVDVMLSEGLTAGVLSLPRDKFPKQQFQDDIYIEPAEAVKFLRAKKLYITGLLSRNLTADVSNVLIRGIMAGKGLPELRQDLTDLFEPYVGDPKAGNIGDIIQPHRLNTIIRTNLTEAFNMGRVVQARRDLGTFLYGWQWSSIIDNRTTPICRFLDGRIFRDDDPYLQKLTPPRHFNCRSILIPITLVDVENDEVDKKQLMTKQRSLRAMALSPSGF